MEPNGRADLSDAHGEQAGGAADTVPGGVRGAILRLLPGGRAARGVLALAGGSSVAQLVVLGVTPALTRIYDPASFGVLAAYASVLGIAGSVACLRYETAVPLPKEDAEATQVLAVAGAVAIATTILGALCLWAWGPALVRLLRAPDLSGYLWLLPVGLAGVGFYQALTFWAVRHREYATVARTRVSQGVGGALVQLVLGLVGSGAVGLLVGQIVGQGAGIGTPYALGDETRDRRFCGANGAYLLH